MVKGSRLPAAHPHPEIPNVPPPPPGPQAPPLDPPLPGKVEVRYILPLHTQGRFQVYLHYACT